MSNTVKSNQNDDDDGRDDKSAGISGRNPVSTIDAKETGVMQRKG
jgi:hypothetical protein